MAYPGGYRMSAASGGTQAGLAVGASTADMPMSAPASAPLDERREMSPPSMAPAARSRGAVASAPSLAAHATGTQPPQSNTSTEPRAGTVEQAPAQSMIIYSAQIHAQVEHVPAAIDQIVDAIVAQGGFLAARTDQTVTVRVPVARFREAIGRIEAMGTVFHRDVQAEDISESFHDLEVRLQNLRSVQARLQQFLARAASVNDALTVERELERVGGQIDEIEGRMRFLGNRAAFSTITVTLTPRPVVTTVVAPPPTYPGLPDINLPFEVLEQLGLPRLLGSR